MAELCIEDSGSGIPEEMLAKVFEPYVSAKPKGSGLGLAIVKKIIDEHRGKIEVQSEVEKGTCFRVNLPKTG